MGNLRPSSPGQLALFALIPLGVGLLGVLGSATPFALYLGILMLVVATAGYFGRPQSRTVYWRGQQIDMSDQLNWWGQLYYRIFRK